MRFLTAGESHGPGLTAIIEGLPANLFVSEKAKSWVAPSPARLRPRRTHANRKRQS